MQELIDNTIANYQLLQPIARGGMAEIFLARDTRTDTQVALKVVRDHEEYCARLYKEVEVMASLQHKHIIPVIDHGEYEDCCYFSMPYISYGTLNEHLSHGPLSPEECSHILNQLADALQYAHDHGIIHRDIKPSNILLQDGNYVYLSDFGLVKRIGFQNGLTLSGYMIGTADYMAPELADDEASPRSDIYAVGILLYQMLTGTVPFKGTSPINIFMKHLNEEALPPSLLNPAISPALESVVMKAIEKNARYRFASASELAKAFQHALTTGEPITEDFATTEPVPPPTFSVVRTSGLVARTTVPKKVPGFALVGSAALVSAALTLGMLASFIGTPSPRALSQSGHPTQAQQMTLIKTAQKPTPTPTPTPTPPPTPTPTSKPQPPQNNNVVIQSQTYNTDDNSSQKGDKKDTQKGPKTKHKK